MNRGRILVVPAFEQGRGGGHLCRCISLTVDLRATGREAWLFLPAADANTNDLFQSMNFAPEWRITDDDLPRICSGFVECVVLDRFQTPKNELLRWKEIAPVAGIDEGGPCRSAFDFLIDILIPEKLGKPPANIANPFLLKFPSRPPVKKLPADGKLKVLVSFGQEDSAGLGTAVAKILSRRIKREPIEITLLRGKLAKSNEIESLPHIRVLDAIPNLAERLGEYDVVITHYGITAYEALFAETPVFLVAPTAYHAKLAKAAGFRNLPRSFKELSKHRTRGTEFHREDLAALINGFSPQVNRRCPVCGENAPLRAISRFPDRTYRRCSGCGVIYMDRTCAPPIEYEREYFNESYKRQYGKTYLEDFPNIKNAGKRRLKIINSLLPASADRALLDIGCAYGPFLAAAREENFSPAGIDPAEDAVRYVTQTLNIPAARGFFPHSPLPNAASHPHSPFYDAVTLWYVIEHFNDCAAALAAIRNILKPGGVLAFSTPSSLGISGKTSLRDFLSASPADHLTVWSPAMCKKALALAGFKVKKTVISGHHPERFPLLGKFAGSKKNPPYWMLLAISKIFRLGDTFEVYASYCRRK